MQRLIMYCLSLALAVNAKIDKTMSAASPIIEYFSKLLQYGDFQIFQSTLANLLNMQTQKALGT